MSKEKEVIKVPTSAKEWLVLGKEYAELKKQEADIKGKVEARKAIFLKNLPIGEHKFFNLWVKIQEVVRPSYNTEWLEKNHKDLFDKITTEKAHKRLTVR